MSETFQRILHLIEKKDIKISSHGYDELVEDKILFLDIMHDVKNGIVIEDYPEYYKGPCVLVLQKDTHGHPIHVVWGIPKRIASPAVLVTAYRPDRKQWEEDFKRRKK
jgi:hypothetical protein